MSAQTNTSQNGHIVVSPLDYLQAVGETIQQVQAEIESHGNNPEKNLVLDETVFNNAVKEKLLAEARKNSLQINSEMSSETGNNNNGGGDDGQGISFKKQDKIMGNKHEGETFLAVQNFIFQGSLKEFANGTVSPSITMQCPAILEAEHRPLTKSVRVTCIQNSTPFPIDVHLSGVNQTTIQMDHRDDTYKKVTYKIPPNAMTPMQVKHSIFDRSFGSGGSSDFFVNEHQLNLAYVTPEQIQSSIKFPHISEFLSDGETVTPMAVQKYNASMSAFQAAKRCFVEKNSPLGKFIQMSNSNIGSKLKMPLDETFVNHYIMHQDEVNEHIAKLNESLENSPVGKLHGMVGTISRHDEKPWDHIPSSISPEEADSLLNNMQTIQFTVEHSMQVHLG